MTIEILALIAAAALVVIGSAINLRRRRIQKGYDEMRRRYGRDWR